MSEEQKTDYKFEEGKRRAALNLEEIRFRNREEWEKEVKLRRLDRRMVTEWLPYPQYQPLLYAWRKARDEAMGVTP